MPRFYHEINHLYDVYMRLINGQCEINAYAKFDRMAMVASLGLSNTKWCDNELVNNLLNTIIYRFLSDCEFYALASNVYGELMGMKSKRKNFQTDLKNTMPYSIYNDVRNNYKKAFGYLNDTERNFIISSLEKNGYRFNSKENKSKYRELINKVEYRIRELLKKMGSSASAWYDREEGLINESTVNYYIEIVDPPIRIDKPLEL